MVNRSLSRQYLLPRHHVYLVSARLKAAVITILALFCLWSSGNRSAHAQVVISQVYAGGGAITIPSAYLYDYVELYNNSATSINLSAYSLQYSAASGTAIAVVQGILPLSGVIAPRSFFLVQTGQSGVTGGFPPVTPDFTPTMPDVGPSLGSLGGKVILAVGATAITFTTGSLTTLPDNVVDFVGYGTANTYEGAGPAPAPGSNFNAITRTMFLGTMRDTDDNAADFTAIPVSLRNSLSMGSSASAPEPGTLALLAFSFPLMGRILRRW